MRRDCGAAGCSSETYSIGRRLDDPIAGEERLDHTEHLRRIPFRAAFNPAEHSPVAVDQKTRRQAPYLEGVPDDALWIDIGFDELEPELGDKRLDNLAAAAILGYGNDGDPVAEARLQALE